MMNRAASSDSEAEAITNLMICAMESTALLNHGNGSFSERNMCAPAPQFLKQNTVRVLINKARYSYYKFYTKPSKSTYELVTKYSI